MDLFDDLLDFERLVEILATHFGHDLQTKRLRLGNQIIAMPGIRRLHGVFAHFDAGKAEVFHGAKIGAHRALLGGQPERNAPRQHLDAVAVVERDLAADPVGRQPVGQAHVIGDLGVVDDGRRDLRQILGNAQRNADLRHQQHAVAPRLGRNAGTSIIGNATCA